MRDKHDLGQSARTKLSRLVSSNFWTLFAFLSGLGLGFLALTELRTGPIVAGLAGLGAYFLIAFVIPKQVKQRVLSGGHTASPHQGPSQSEPDPRVDLLVEAHQHAATLAAAQSQMPLTIGETIHRLHGHAQVIIEAVTRQPEKLTPVLRFFTYYLPSTADLVMDRIKLAPHAGSTRLQEIDQTLARLVEAFAGFEKAVRAPDLQSVDLDVELLDQALDADLEDLKR